MTPPARAGRSSGSRSAPTRASCRTVALGTPTERERTQWYFQRYVPHLPAAGRDRPVRPLLVQPRRRRAGHGLRHRRRRSTSSCGPARSSSARSCGPGSSSSSTGCRSATRSRSAASRPASTTRRRAGSSARWTSRPARTGSTTPRPRTRCSRSRTPRSARGSSSTPTTSARPRLNLIAHLLSLVPYRARPAQADQAAAAPEAQVRAPAARHPDLRAAALHRGVAPPTPPVAAGSRP